MINELSRGRGFPYLAAVVFWAFSQATRSGSCIGELRRLSLALEKLAFEGGVPTIGMPSGMKGGFYFLAWNVNVVFGLSILLVEGYMYNHSSGHFPGLELG